MEKKLKRLANCRVDCACLAKYEIFVDLVCNWSRTREREERREHKTEKTFFFAIFLVSTIFFFVLKISTYILYIHIMYVFRNFSSIHFVNSNHFEMLNLW